MDVDANAATRDNESSFVPASAIRDDELARAIEKVTADEEEDEEEGGHETGDGATTAAAGERRKMPLRGKMPPRLTHEQRTRVIYLFAEVFRRHPPALSLRPAAKIVVEQWKQESGVQLSLQAMCAVYRRQGTPIPQRKQLKPRGRPATAVTEERKKEVEQILADPNIPLEMKTTRKIRSLLPGVNGKIAPTTIGRIFKEIKKEKHLPKPQKQSLRQQKSGKGQVVVVSGSGQQSASAPLLPDYMHTRPMYQYNA